LFKRRILFNSFSSVWYNLSVVTAAEISSYSCNLWSAPWKFLLPFSTFSSVLGFPLSWIMFVFQTNLNPKSINILTLCWRDKDKEFWLQKSETWKSNKDLNHPVDALLIQKLVRNLSVEEMGIQKQLFQSFEEQKYIRAIINAIVEGHDLTSQGETCLWVAIVHRETFLKRII